MDEESVSQMLALAVSISLFQSSSPSLPPPVFLPHPSRMLQFNQLLQVYSLQALPNDPLTYSLNYSFLLTLLTPRSNL